MIKNCSPSSPPSRSGDTISKASRTPSKSLPTTRISNTLQPPNSSLAVKPVGPNTSPVSTSTFAIALASRVSNPIRSLADRTSILRRGKDRTHVRTLRTYSQSSPKVNSSLPLERPSPFAKIESNTTSSSEPPSSTPNLFAPTFFKVSLSTKLRSPIFKIPLCHGQSLASVSYSSKIASTSPTPPTSDSESFTKSTTIPPLATRVFAKPSNSFDVNITGPAFANLSKITVRHATIAHVRSLLDINPMDYSSSCRFPIALGNRFRSISLSNSLLSSPNSTPELITPFSSSSTASRRCLFSSRPLAISRPKVLPSSLSSTSFRSMVSPPT